MLQETLLALSITLAQLQLHLHEQQQTEIQEMGEWPGFSNLPVAFQQVILCESNGQQFTSSGKVLTSKTKDKGIMQINAPIHEKTAKGMGWNINTLEGNLAYGYWLYQKDGLRHWVCAHKLGLI